MAATGLAPAPRRASRHTMRRDPHRQRVRITNLVATVPTMSVTLGRLHRLRTDGPAAGDERSRLLHDRRFCAINRAQRGSSHTNGDHGAESSGRRPGSVGARPPPPSNGVKAAEGVKGSLDCSMIRGTWGPRVSQMGTWGPQVRPSVLDR
jgi:hypothetical protein